MSDVSAVIIEELDGEHRKVTLSGPALPFQGASWKSHQNVVTRWYPGNGAQATQQVLGPSELPSSWEGMWRRTMMARYPSTVEDSGGVVQVTRPKTLRDVLDSIFFGGSRLRVSWITTGDEEVKNGKQSFRDAIVREGRCTDWEFPHDRVHDIGWKFTFEWYGRGAVVQSVIATREADKPDIPAQVGQSLADVVAKINENRLMAANSRIPRSANSFSLGQLEALANYPKKLLGEFTRNLNKISSSFKQLTGIINTVRNLPFSLANGVVASLRNAKSVIHQFTDTFSRTPVELQTLSRQLRDLTRTTEYHGRVYEAAQLSARQLQQLESSVHRPTKAGGNGAGSIKSSTTIAVHIVKQGETLQTISRKYYGSPDHAVEIAKANKLPWHITNVDRGTPLVIPVLSNGGI